MPQQDKVLATIKSSATLSLGRIEHSNCSGCLFKKIPLSAFKKAVMMGDDLTRTHMTIPLRAVTTASTGIS